MAKSCNHRLKNLCKCPEDAPTTDVESAARQHAAQINERIASDRVETADLPEFTPPKKRPGPKPTPWQERAATTPPIAQVIMAALEDPARREALIKLLVASTAYDDFAEFCRQAWHVIEPATTLEWNWHHTLLCNTLQALFESWLRAGEVQNYVPPILNTVINVCPGSLKSRITNVFFPAWVWLRSPGVKFICLSVNEDATMRDARAARDLVKSDWFQSTFQPKWKLKGDQDAISNYGNNAGGERLSKASGAQIVGLRADILIYDDPNSPDESLGERELINKVWDESIYSRVNSGTRSLRIGIQQRVGGGDWTDHILKKQGHWGPDPKDRGGWLNVVLPAEYEAARKFTMPQELAELLRKKLGDDALISDPRTVEGESVHPKRFDVETLARERRRWEGTGNYASQYQQRPALQSGNWIKRKYWGGFRLDGGVRPEFDEVPKGRPRPAECEWEPVLIKAKHHMPGYWDFDWVCLSLDCAAKKTDKGSNWGMVVVGGKGGRRYVLDDRTKRGDILEVVEILRALILMWKPDRILIENKAAGEDLKIRLKGEMEKGDMPMVIVEEVKVGAAGKEERLMACLPTIANGNVYLLDGAMWLNEFVEEMSDFPNGTRDDRVDALSQVLNFYYEPTVEDVGADLPDW